MKKLLLFGGTTEGRLLVETAASLGWLTTLCVATEYGKEVLPRQQLNCRVLVGRLDREQIIRLMDEGFDRVIDATHPYAVEVSANIRFAAASTGLPLWRLLREQSNAEGCRFADTIPQACAMAGEGNLLAATGSKEIEQYHALPGWQQRVYARVLPTAESVELCRRAGLDEEHILTGKGPFTTEQNLQILKAFSIKTLVTKESGPAGGFAQKLEAAALCQAEVLVLRRPQEDGFYYEEIAARLKEEVEP